MLQMYVIASKHRNNMKVLAHLPELSMTRLTKHNQVCVLTRHKLKFFSAKLYQQLISRLCVVMKNT